MNSWKRGLHNRWKRHQGIGSLSGWRDRSCWYRCLQGAIALLSPLTLSLPVFAQVPLSWRIAAAETEVLPPGPGAFLPDFPTFNSGLLDQQLYLYGNYLLSNGPPDVLIVGSSRALQGIDPAVLQQVLTERGLSHVEVYNFSINGATAQVVDFMVRRLLAPEQLPRMVIWADGSRAFNSARTDVTFNGITASPGYQRLMTGDRPIPVLPPLALYYDDQNEFCVDAGPIVSDTLLALPCPAPVAQQGKDAPVVRTLTASLPQPDVFQLTDKGFNPVATEYDPRTYFQRFPRVAGRYDANYSPFQLAGVQTDATQAIARYLANRQIPLVFVSLPLHTDHFDSYRQSREQQFRQHMQQLANQQGFIYLDLSRQWSDQNRYFQDPSHLNRNGARAVAEHLATVTTLPWNALMGIHTLSHPR